MQIDSSPLLVERTPGRFGWIDFVVLAILAGLLWSALHFGAAMMVRFDPGTPTELDPSPWAIPNYAGRTLLRMWIAFAVSLGFAIVVGYLAAKSRWARRVILPSLDVLQSVPVLGFLSATVAGFMALFPGSLLGVECASIFAIFTSQVWNMAFGFYYSMVSVPSDLQEAATAFGLSAWQRFRLVELPFSAHGLIWNSMMSFGGGWFFVAQSEAITVMNRDIRLPGLGSWMAQAIDRGDGTAAAWAIVAMVVLIVLSDQLVWRPLLAWADRFKVELTESATPPTSWVYNRLRGAWLFTTLLPRLWLPLSDRLRRAGNGAPLVDAARRTRLLDLAGRVAAVVFVLFVIREGVIGLAAATRVLSGVLDWAELAHIGWLGVLTALRVLAMTVLATLIWTPIGIWIGLTPSIARIAQPLAQIGASFPVNMTFPVVVGLFVSTGISLNWGSILLIAMGTQWYILFNVIAGAMAIPTDLREAARVNGLRGWSLWRVLLLPAVFPFWVTGACTAAGGAWNASIVAELASWGDTTLKAEGLGAFLAEATRVGNTPMIIVSIVVMALFVLAMDNLIWRPLYRLAERRFRLD